MTSASWSSVKSITEVKELLSSRSLLGKSLNIRTTDANCCALVVVYRYGGVIFVVQAILWCGISVVYAVY